MVKDLNSGIFVPLQVRFCRDNAHSPGVNSGSVFPSWDIDLSHRRSLISALSGLCCCARCPTSQSTPGSGLERLHLLLTVQSGSSSSRAPFCESAAAVVGLLLAAGWNLLLRSSVLCNGRVSSPSTYVYSHSKCSFCLFYSHLRERRATCRQVMFLRTAAGVLVVSSCRWSCVCVAGS